MFIIVWGRRYILLTIGTGEFICPKCHITQKFKHRLRKLFFTLYYIPLFPIGNGEDYIECQNCKGTFRSGSMATTKLQDTIQHLQVSNSTYQVRHPLWRAYLIVAGLIFGCMFLTNLQAANETRERERQSLAVSNTQIAIINNYGSENFSLCKKFTDVAMWEINSTARLLAVDNSNLSLWNEYQQLLPDSVRAESRSDLTHVLCLEQSAKEYDTDEYADDDGKVVYTCTRYRRYIDAYLISVESRETVGHRKFKGEVPPECPEKTSRNLSQYGDDPAAADIIDSLKLE